MSSEHNASPEDKDIEKMLSTSRTKPVPPHILKGFKDDVLRRIEAQKAAKPARVPSRWFSSDWKLPRVGVSVGVGALACLIIASLAVLTVEKPAPMSSAPKSAAFQVASVPSAAPITPTALSARAFDKMVAPQTAPQAATPAPARRTKLTVEEQLRLIEEFDDQKFFIRQDISDKDLASA